MPRRKRAQGNRGPITHVARVPLTNEEHVEVETLADLDRTTHAETIRRAIREYAAHKLGRQG